jgi:predicted RNase H-like HicB family nuclease
MQSVLFNFTTMKEITFLVHEAEEGGYYAEAIGRGIFAEGDTIADLKENIKGGIDCHFEDKTDAPVFAHLHFVKDEIMAL